MTIKRGENKRPLVDFGAALAAKALAEPQAALPRPLARVLQTNQITDPGDTERPVSFYQGFDELKGAMKAYSEIDGDRVGNHHNIAVVGTQAPYEVVAGRRRYAAAKALRLPIRANVYPHLSSDQRQLVQETENQNRTSLAASEIVGKLHAGLEEDKTQDQLATVFGMGESTVRLYLAVGKDKALLGELDRGLSLNAARRLMKEHGDAAGEKARELRQEAGAEAHVREKGGRSKAEETAPKPALQTVQVPEKSVTIRFNEKAAKSRDFEKYHEFLSVERDRVGKIIQAHERRRRG